MTVVDASQYGFFKKADGHIEWEYKEKAKPWYIWSQVERAAQTNFVFNV